MSKIFITKLLNLPQCIPSYYIYHNVYRYQVIKFTTMYTVNKMSDNHFETLNFRQDFIYVDATQTT